MKKFFGWVFIVIGALNIIVAFIMMGEGVFDSGSQNPFGKLFYGIGFVALGTWMVNSANKKAYTTEVDRKTEQVNSTTDNDNTTFIAEELKSNNFHGDKSVYIDNQFVRALFLSETLEIAKEQFKSGTEIMPIDAFDISFRLLKTDSNSINLEYLAVSRNRLRYFKPVGSYTDDMVVTVLNEYHSGLSKLKDNGVIPKGITLNSFDLKSEAVIAAFSMETIIQVMDIFEDFEQRGWRAEIVNGIEIPGYMKYDRKYYANGLASQLILTQEGYPQFFLDDKYGLQGPIGAYFNKQGGNLGINPIIDYKDLFDELLKKRLLTAYKKL